MLYLALAALAFGLIIGLARGGRVEQLQYLHFRGLWLALGPLALQVAIFQSPLGDWLGAALGAVHVASYVLLLAPIALNWHLNGLRLVALGLVLNAVVIAANGGFMPVSPAGMQAAGIGERFAVLEEAGRSQKSIPMTADTRLALLSDWIPLPLLGKVISPGDVFISLGGMVVVAAGMGRGRRSKRVSRRAGD